MTSKNVDQVEHIYERFGARDIPAVLAGFAPKIKWTVSDGFPYAGTFIGGEAVVENVFAKVAGDWDGFRHELTDWIDAGSSIVVHGVYHGTWKATGRTMKAPFVHVWTLSGGLVERFRQYVDVPATKAATDGFEHRTG